MVADLISHSVYILASNSCSDSGEHDLIQLLHAPLQAMVSLQELQQASEQDSTLSTLCTDIRTGWPSHVPEELMPFACVKEDLSCWNDTCVAAGSALWSQMFCVRVIWGWCMRVTWA